MQKLIEMKNKKGFTLIEMLIVILIIVILLAIAVPAVAAYRREALKTQDEGAIETIQTAIEAAMIQVRPADTDTGIALDEHVTGDLSYETLVTLSESTTLDDDTKEFYALLAEFLGPNFQGNFKFHYSFESTYGSGSTAEYLYWLTYWRSEPASDDTILLYHNNFSNITTEYREPEYLADVIEKYPTLGGYYNFNQYRPTP